MAFLHSIYAPKVGDNAMARLAVLVAVGFDNLQVAALTAFVDPYKHTYMICPKTKPKNIYIGNVCDYMSLPTLRDSDPQLLLDG